MSIRDIFHREHKSREAVIEEAFAQIKEDRAFAAACGYDSEQLHCKGCIFSCPLSRAKCDTGRCVIPVFELLSGKAE